MQEEMEKLIISGRKKVVEKRQREISIKLVQIINNYEKIVQENKKIFDEYHNSFGNDKALVKMPDVIKYFSNEINKLDLNEFDLELIIDKEKNLSLLDYIIKNKPYLKLSYFSIGGSNANLGYRLLEKIFLSNDKEYIKYLPLIGFKGSPELFLFEINGKKVIDYLIDNYDLYKNFCGIEFDFKVNDYLTKQYLMDNINSYIDRQDKNKLYCMLNVINFTSRDLISDININGNVTNVIELYLNKDILKDAEKLKNLVIPNKIFFSLVKIYIDINNISLKNEIRRCLNSLYIEDTLISSINKKMYNYLKDEKIYLKKQEVIDTSNDDSNFYNYLSKLEMVLKTGISTSQEMINYVKNNYINMHTLNRKIALKEIQALILIKKNNPKFHIVDSNIGPNFDADTIHLVLTDNNSIGWHKEDNYVAFNHEMTHAIQYYCFNDDTPKDFYGLLPNVYDLVKLISKYCIDLISMMKNDLKRININNREQAISNLSLNKYSYNREVVDIFDSIICFTDTLMQLGYEDADLIEGHPYDYMKYGGYDFSEILADYKSIWCSNRKDLYLFVKDNLGSECSTYIEAFYEMILDNYIALYYQSDEKNMIELNVNSMIK